MRGAGGDEIDQSRPKACRSMVALASGSLLRSTRAFAVASSAIASSCFNDGGLKHGGLLDRPALVVGGGGGRRLLSKRGMEFFVRLFLVFSVSFLADQTGEDLIVDELGRTQLGLFRSRGRVPEY